MMNPVAMIDQVNDALYIFGSNTRVFIGVETLPDGEPKPFVQACDKNDDVFHEAWLGPKEKGAAK